MARAPFPRAAFFRFRAVPAPVPTKFEQFLSTFSQWFPIPVFQRSHEKVVAVPRLPHRPMIPCP